VPQAHIAHWSGRKHVAQNVAYDHTDTFEVVDELLRQNKEHNQELPLPVIIDDRNEEFMSAHNKSMLNSTFFGYCVGDFRENPCDKAGACTSCTRLVCLGGATDQAIALQSDVNKKQKSYENMQEREAKKMRINPKTKAAIQQNIAHAEVLIEAIKDPINKGVFIQNKNIAPLSDFSHHKRIIEVRDANILAQSKNETLK
jgi:hypothetical protein